MSQLFIILFLIFIGILGLAGLAEVLALFTPPIITEGTFSNLSNNVLKGRLHVLKCSNSLI